MDRSLRFRLPFLLFSMLIGTVCLAGAAPRPSTGDSRGGDHTCMPDSGTIPLATGVSGRELIGSADREFWLAQLDRIARPVIETWPMTN
jgi:hypothetical protein